MRHAGGELVMPLSRLKRCSASLRGSSRRRVVPALGGLWRSIRPPSASARSLRPSSPVPPARVAPAASVVADLHPQRVGGVPVAVGGVDLDLDDRGGGVF